MTIRLLTLNVWALGGPFSSDNEARMRAIGEALGRLQPDVAAFQETWHAPSRSVLIASARGAGLDQVWHNPDGLTGSGLLVLSRWPIRRAQLRRFALRGVAEAISEADYLGRKGFVELEIDTPEGPLVCFDTHLQAAYKERARDPYVALRIGQVVQLAARLREIRAPLVLAGDLNFADTTPEHAILTGLAKLSDVAGELGERQPTTLESNPYRSGPGERIDYLFYRSGRTRGLAPLSLERVLDEPLAIEGRSRAYSDHAGLLGEFELGGSGAALAAPDPAALRDARAALEAGRREVVLRQQRQRVFGAGGLVALATALGAARRPALSRRRFIKGGLIAVGALAGVFGAGRLVLAEVLRPEELRGFDAVRAQLDALERSGRAARRSISRPA